MLSQLVAGFQQNGMSWIKRTQLARYHLAFLYPLKSRQQKSAISISPYFLPLAFG